MTLRAITLALALGPAICPAATFVVTNLNDSGAGTLRRAILDANANAGADVITFNLGPGGVQTLILFSVLPEATDPVTIDGTTQPGYAGAPLIELNGGTQPGHGIVISGPGGALIAGCYIGTDTNGGAAKRNRGQGVSINNSANNIIGGTDAADRKLAQTFLSAGSGDFPVPCLYRPRRPRNWKVP